MDTLLIVRKIREAESLADAGQHDDARRLLVQLQGDPALTDTHRNLIAKKLDLFSKQQQRMTRIMSRQTETPRSGDTTAELTAVDRTERDRSDRATDVLREQAPHGVDTEVVPKSSDTEAGVPRHERKHRIPTLPIDQVEERLDADDDPTPEEPQDPPRRSERRDTDRPTIHDSRVLRPTARPPKVTDSVVMPRVEEDPPAPGPGKVLASDDEYFAPRGPQSSARSDPELQALARDLPEDDLRRELALEVVRLREEMERMKGHGEPSTRKLRNPERPTGGSFHIPASQVNTIVRTAAGTNGIDVHIPGRDDDANELRVLRRDSVRGAPAPENVDERIAVAQDYIDAASIRKPSVLKPLAIWLAFAAGVALVGWVVYAVYSMMNLEQADVWVITEDAAGPYKLGTPASGYPDLGVQAGTGPGTATDKARGWKVEYNAQDTISALIIPGPAAAEAQAATRFKAVRLKFKGKEISSDWSKGNILKTLGDSDPPYDDEAFKSADEYTLRYPTGEGALHFIYRTTAETAPVRIILRAGAE